MWYPYRSSICVLIPSVDWQFFVSIWVFFHDHLRITWLQGKSGGGGISLTPLYHFHPLHRHRDISRAITAESSPLHVGSSRTRNRLPHRFNVKYTWNVCRDPKTIFLTAFKELFTWRKLRDCLIVILIMKM